MKLFTALTLIYATLAAAAPSHLLLRDNKPPLPMMPMYISSLPSDNDDSNMKCSFFEVKQRDLRHAMEWGTNLRISKHYNGSKQKTILPALYINARDDTIVLLPLFRISRIYSLPSSSYFFEYPIIEDGFYAGEDDTLLFRVRNKKANGSYLSYDLEDFFAYMPLRREEANIGSSVGSESPRRDDFV
ncbi:hypothetical protein D6C78_05235 [Aureobasidium pullulans]|uniref:Uncharacterized protein n=1 Tax=Aureobasidium pullulans TaxID=5580 RepID=A0A4T0BVA7_AURPU|nr:hypothetical protein D6C78_05235 [Aureobasidium pullulans]